MTSVPTLHVRNVPPTVYERLRARAVAEGRSINATVIGILEESIDRETAGQEIARRLKALAKRYPLPPDAPDPVDLIRSDRDSR